ncbi:hypothetical protein A2239_04330 [Candidatus Uhrbacteria bacterium RIFOXYA2_FULL_40_9]|nr:MAG: hypothetical protein A2239_04330 [Candidatus Uhrbacteria bacterium RIFOXYA2_FULL_40_9]
MRDLQNARTQAQATAREQEIQDLRERYKALAESFRAYVGLLDIETIQAYHRVGRMLQGETYGRVWIQRPLESVESALRVAQAKASEKLALTTIIWTKLREQYPVCPLCGQAWVSEGRVLKCSNADGHSPARLVPLDPDSGDNAIAEIQTDRGEFIALVELRNGRVMMSVEVANSHPWVGKTFSKVTITTLQAILPPKLADQHDEIVENLSDLREMQAQHLVLQEQMKKAQTEHGSGQVKVLKFAGKTDDLGRPTAEEGIYQYTVPFEEMLTVQNGGTWVCRLGVRSGRDISVHPLFKMEVMEEDIEEMKQLLRESYEGIPEVLL